MIKKSSRWTVRRLPGGMLAGVQRRIGIPAFAALTALGLCLTACSKSPAPAPMVAQDEHVHNAFTAVVDSGVSTMNNAEQAANNANDLIHQQEQQAQTAGD